MLMCSDERQDKIEGWKSRGEREAEEVREVPRLQEPSGGAGDFGQERRSHSL